MDLLLKNGELETDVNGYPVQIHGIDEAVQRAEIVLSIEKGSFIYDETLGSELDSAADENAPNDLIVMLCREALADQTELTVESVRTEKVGNKIKLIAAILSGEETKEAEVTINAEL